MKKIMDHERLSRAVGYAARIHRNQFRKETNIPYISHLLGTASIAMEYGATEDEAIAALLHDTIEDCKEQPAVKTREQILEQFGARVLSIVEGCSDADKHPKPPWRERKEAYIRHLKEMPRSVHMVSAADKLHNSRSIVQDHHVVGEKIWERFNCSKNDTLWYYRALVSAYEACALAPSHLIKDLDAVVEEMEVIEDANMTKEELWKKRRS